MFCVIWVLISAVLLNVFSTNAKEIKIQIDSKDAINFMKKFLNPGTLRRLISETAKNPVQGNYKNPYHPEDGNIEFNDKKFENNKENESDSDEIDENSEDRFSDRNIKISNTGSSNKFKFKINKNRNSTKKNKVQTGDDPEIVLPRRFKIRTFS